MQNNKWQLNYINCKLKIITPIHISWIKEIDKIYTAIDNEYLYILNNRFYDYVYSKSKDDFNSLFDSDIEKSNKLKLKYLSELNYNFKIIIKNNFKDKYMRSYNMWKLNLFIRDNNWIYIPWSTLKWFFKNLLKNQFYKQYKYTDKEFDKYINIYLEDIFIKENSYIVDLIMYNRKEANIWNVEVISSWEIAFKIGYKISYLENLDLKQLLSDGIREVSKFLVENEKKLIQKLWIEFDFSYEDENLLKIWRYKKNYNLPLRSIYYTKLDLKKLPFWWISLTIN